MGGKGHLPEPGELEEARTKVGMHLVHLNAEDSTVRFEREGVMLDLGAIGKGYAIERAAEVLREAGVKSALLHGGTSTIYAIGHPPDAEFWLVAVERPGEEASSTPLAKIPLEDEALSVSAVWGRSFESEGKAYGHVLDPRTGQPAANASLAAVVLPSATETDALSTALLTVGEGGHGAIAGLRAGMRTLLVMSSNGGLRTEAKGIVVEPMS
jgi:thiamine biosynthesis lipoprotein